MLPTLQHLLETVEHIQSMAHDAENDSDAFEGYLHTMVNIIEGKTSVSDNETRRGWKRPSLPRELYMALTVLAEWERFNSEREFHVFLYWLLKQQYADRMDVLRQIVDLSELEAELNEVEQRRDK